MREEFKKSNVILLSAITLSVLIILVAVICTGALQKNPSIHSNTIASNANLNKIKNYSSLGSGTSGGTTPSDGGGGGGGGGASSSGGSLTPALSGVTILAGAESLPLNFSNLSDNSGTLVGSGIARFNVSITGTNGSVGISIGGKNYGVDNNNWLDFDGSGDYVDYGNNAQFSTNKGVINSSISFYALITPMSTNKTMSVISKVGITPNNEYDLQFDNGGNIAFYIYQRAGGVTPYCTIATGPVNGEARYVAGKTYFVYAEYINDTSCSLQIDGGDKLTSTNIDRTNPTVSGTANLRIGQRYGNGFNNFTGSVDNFAFYNKSLNPIQVQRIYNEKNWGESIPVISYHRIYNDMGAQEVVNKANFAAQMKFLNDSGYKTITYQQWDSWTKGIGTIPEKPIIIGFDDGWYSVYKNAKPIMDNYSYVGVVAVYGYALEGAQGSGEEEGAMNFTQLQVLSNNGWEIASHSYTHQDMLNLSEDTNLLQEFSDSKNYIQNHLVGVNVTTFIYPYDISNVVTDAECGKYYSICSGYSAYPEHAGIEGDEDFFIFKSTNKIYTGGNPIGMRRVAITSYTTLADFKYYIDYSDGQQINSKFNENSGSIAYDSSGKGNNGTITGATWDNNLYHKEIFLNSGTYPYYWWAYGNDGTYGFSSPTRYYIVHPPYVVNVFLNITSPTTASPVVAANGSNLSIYFNFLNSSSLNILNVISGVAINDVVIGGQPATILSSSVVKTNNTYSASKIYTKVTDSDLTQAPAWNDAWDGTENSGCYTSTSTSNNNYCILTVSGGFFVRDREPWARFNFTIPEDVNTITSIKITAEAKADSSSTSEDVAFIIANFAAHEWQRFAQPDTRPEATKITIFTSGFSDIIQNGQLVLLLEGDGLDDGESIGIDYVSVTVNATSSSGGKQFAYTNKGWQVNVTTPNATDGLQDLFVNATWTSYYWYVGNDTQREAIDYRTDIIFPDIQITSPLNNINTTNVNLDINYTVNDTNLVSCWYTNDSYIINNSINSIICGENITNVIWAEGQHNVTVWAKDMSNNVNSSSVIFRIDTTPPSILILYPSNNTNTSNKQINVNYTAFDAGVGISSCWYSNTSGAVNYSLSGCANITGVTWLEGINKVDIWANDSMNNVNKGSIRFTVDITAPNATLLVPANNSYSKSTSNNFTANISDNLGIQNATLNVINSTGNTVNQTTVSYGGGILNTIIGIVVNLFTEGKYTWFYNLFDVAGNNYVSPNNSLTIDTTKPAVMIISPVNNTNSSNSGLDINYAVSDLNGLSACWYSNDSFAVNTSLASCSTNITAVIWSQGKHNVIVYANDTSNNVNWSSVSFTIDIPPHFTTIPPATNINYTQGFGVDFNATDDIAFGTYAINWTTLFSINADGLLTNSTPNIAPGNYYINVTINDTLNSLNSTIYLVAVSKATPLGSVSGTSPINYGTAVNVTGTETNIGDTDVFYKLFRNNIEVSNPDTSILEAGTYNYVYNTTGGANWSASASINNKTVIVQATSSQISLTFNAASPQNYGTVIIPNCSVTSGDGIAVLKMDGNIITSGIPLNLGANIYSFNCSVNKTANYNASSITSNFTINKAVPALTITGTSPITYGTLTDVAGSGCVPQLTCSLDKANAVYGAGTIAFNYSTAGNANYTAGSNSKSIVINKAALNYVVTLTSPINYLTPSNYAGRITNGDAGCSPILYRTAVHLGNGAVSIGSGFSVSDTAILDVGTYIYNYSATGCVNYTDSENIKTLFVNLIRCYSNAECDDSNAHTQDICNNPGTPQSSCSHLTIACLANSECGTDAYTSDATTCQSENVWQNFITYTCNNPGISSSSCSDSTSLKLKETCTGGCIDGRCKVQSCKTVCNFGVCKDYCVWQ